MYKIILSDGREINNLTKNGNNYVSKEKVNESIFINNLDFISITDGKTIETINNAVFVQQIQYSDG